MQLYHTAILWAQFGFLSRALGRVSPLEGPPILVTSLPRSGSSWVGDVLGGAHNALHLQEPLAQSLMTYDSKFPVSVFEISAGSPPWPCPVIADYIFEGLPIFPPKVVRNPERWSVLKRRGRRLVVKEVNPLAIEWLLESYRPRVIYLVRHPAAVALSYHKLGWHDMALRARFSDRRWREIQAVCEPETGNFWHEHGVFQGSVMRFVLKALEGYPDALTVEYEQLCARPVEVFRELFDFGKLRWDKKIERTILEKSFGNAGERDPWSTNRNSHDMIGAWKGKITEADVAALRASFLEFGNPHYGPPSCW